MSKKLNFKHFAFSDFTHENFNKFIVQNFHLNTTYSILIKISSKNNLIFKMAGRQIAIVTKNEHDLVNYNKIYKAILTRIESTIDNYDYIDTIDAIELIYSVIIPQKELKLKNISNIDIKTQFINYKEVQKNFNQNLLPFTTDTSYYGYPISIEERKKYINLINSNIKLSKNENSFEINNSDKLFLYNSPNKKNKFIIVSKNINDTNFLRYIFDYESGILIKEIKDTIISNNNSYIKFNRNIDSVTLTIQNQEIVNMKVNNKLNPIKSFTTQVKDRNIKFGSFDLESFRDSDGINRVYALGFITSIDESPKLYYISDNENYDSNQLILNCINDMLINKYNNFIFYVHNLGKYDVIFLYNVLLKANLDKGYEYYILKHTMRDNNIIRLDIKVRINSDNTENNYRYIKISLVDSLNILNYSLDKLTKNFNIGIKKGKFPHSFVNKQTFNYIGNKPNIDYYDNIDITDYNKITETNWNLKEECLKYLNDDIKSLFDIMNEFSRFIYINFNVQMTEALTITRLSLNIYKKKYYKNKTIPSINKIFLFNFIKEGYYGGLTEVYIPYGKDLVYLDINSLYPFAALNSMPGLECNFIKSFTSINQRGRKDKGLDLDNLFGFFYAKVKTNNQYLGLLPLHKDGKLIFPNGEFKGIWFSEELKFAKSKGYDITVIQGYNFNKVEGTFNEFVNELYDLKKGAKDHKKLIFKSLLNNFFGRFGLNIVKPITQTVNKERMDYIISTRNVHSFNIINEEKFLINYDPIISKEICQEHGLDYIKVLEKEHKMNIENKLDIFKDVSIPISAIVNSNARVFMNKIKLEIISKGGKIYYSDTDSLVIDKKDLSNLEKFIGKEIGQFKIEYEIKEAYFISNKTYCLILDDGRTIIKSLGVINNSLNLEDFKSMYWNKSNVVATKFNTITKYDKGSVSIEKKEVTLNYDSYRKREKLYNVQGNWIDTKPLLISDNNNNNNKPKFKVYKYGGEYWKNNPLPEEN
uniref:DNA polymerase n=1 Tax=Moniliophthora roreri (strain MCA 2997) TaxID=1381753 RepID=F2WVN1_MONRO|nr:dnapol [Moniliophthora roreri]